MAMMTSIRGLTSILSGGGSHRGEGTSSISPDMIRLISRQCGSLTPEVLSTCHVSKMHSKFEGCRWDLEVFDSQGKVVAHGREFGSENRYFWLA